MIIEGSFSRYGGRARHGFLVYLAGFAAVAAAVGCSPGTKFEVARVSGTVTLDGKPLNDAIVLFEPKGGRPSRGRTNAAGHYQLLYTVDIAGAAVGPCSVTISTAVEDQEGNLAPERVPARYFEPDALGAAVKPRTNVCDFALTTAP